MGFLSIDPEELIFEHVKLGHAYTQRIIIGNPHDAPVSVTIKPSATSRYQVSPSGEIELPSNGQVVLTIRLKVESFPNRQRGARGQRDSFHLKGAFFEQKFFSTFYLEKDQTKKKQQHQEAERQPNKGPAQQKPNSKTNSKTGTTKRSTVAGNHAAGNSNGSDIPGGLLSSSHPPLPPLPPQPQVHVHRTGSISITNRAADEERFGSGRGTRSMGNNNNNNNNSSSSTTTNNTTTTNTTNTNTNSNMQRWLTGELGPIMAALLQRRSLYGLNSTTMLEMFRMMDVPHRGRVGRPAFHKAMERLDLGLTHAQIDVLLDAMGEEEHGENGGRGGNVENVENVENVNYAQFLTVLSYCENEGGNASPAFLALRLQLSEDDAKQILQLSSSSSLGGGGGGGGALSTSVVSCTQRLCVL